jgi:hypothetical protein
MNRASSAFALVYLVVLWGCAESADNLNVDGVRQVTESGATGRVDAAQADLAKLAIHTLAQDLGVAEDRITVDTIRAVDWRDSSLGCPQPGRAYLQVITPGHRITLRVNGQFHFVHEANGRAFVCRKSKAVSGVTPERELAFGPQLLEARTDLASRLHVAEEEIRLLSAQARTWDDESLGCPEAGRKYEPRKVNGYVLRLRHGSREFTYHTDLVRTIPCPEITDT